MSNKIAVVGDKESILGFSAIGIDIYEAYEENEIKSIVQKLANENYAIIYITENAEQKAQKFLEKFQSMQKPAIITIPQSTGNLKIGENRIKELCKNAIGIDIKF